MALPSIFAWLDRDDTFLFHESDRLRGRWLREASVLGNLANRCGFMLLQHAHDRRVPRPIRKAGVNVGLRHISVEQFDQMAQLCSESSFHEGIISGFI